MIELNQQKFLITLSIRTDINVKYCKLSVYNKKKKDLPYDFDQLKTLCTINYFYY
jgi:hypothetical protein